MIDERPGSSGSRLPDEDPFAKPRQRKASLLERRRAKIVAEIERNRRGEYKVPTWVLVAGILAFIAAWAAVIIFF